MTEQAHSIDADSPRHVCEVIPFPSIRRHGFVERLARMGPKYAVHHLEVHRRTLERKGVDPALIEADVTALANALHACLAGTTDEKVTA
jgi:hypothetical protein